MLTLRDAAWVVGGALAIAAGAQISVPMVPVPTTLQTLAVVAVGLLAGPARGFGAALGYLGLALIGLPVLADGAAHASAAFFDVKTAAYVVGFLPAAATAGAIGARVPTFGGWWVAGLAAHAVVFAIGVPGLAAWIGLDAALTHGFWPFLPGAVVKSGAAAALIATRAR